MPAGADVSGFYNRLGIVLPRRNSEWVPVRCILPEHTDRRASASVNLTSGVLRCFACDLNMGPYRAALARGYTQDDARQLVQEYGLWLEPAKGKTAKTSPRPVVTPAAANVDWAALAAEADEPHPKQIRRREWEYVDQDGEPLFRAVRIDYDDGTKRFWQERHENGRYVAGLNGTRRVLYRLPEVLQHASRRRLVLVVEGEKAVDALDRIGVFATTSPAGAGKWQDVYSLTLKGAIVVPVPDCDPPGRRHAVEVARSLLREQVTVLGPLELDLGRQDGYDVTDRLAELAAGMTGDVRTQLQHHLLGELFGLEQATAQTIRAYEEHAAFRANPAGRELLYCGCCGRERIHTVKAGVRYCPCGGAR